jgi:hypothetical protein
VAFATVVQYLAVVPAVKLEQASRIDDCTVIPLINRGMESKPQSRKNVAISVALENIPVR